MTVYSISPRWRPAGWPDYEPTVDFHVQPEDLSPQERYEIKVGILGYCETHLLLYQRWALHLCAMAGILEDPKPCREWGCTKEHHFFA